MNHRRCHCCDSIEHADMLLRGNKKGKIKNLSEMMADLFVQLCTTIGRALLRRKSRKRTGGRVEN